MSKRNLFFVVLSFIASAFMAVESLLFLSSKGFEPPLFVKIGLCGLFFWNGIKTIKKSKTIDNK